jgi:hypothetical protein
MAANTASDDVAFKQVTTTPDATPVAPATAVVAPVEKKKRTRVPHSADRKPNPWMVHLDTWKTEHPDWKKTMSYKDVLLQAKTTYTKAAP